MTWLAKGLITALFMAVVTPITATAAPAWPTDPRLSGHAFLTPGLQALQADATASPIVLWLDRGEAAWKDTTKGQNCQSCHGDAATLKTAATTFPRLTREGKLINLEDQILRCRQRTGHTTTALEEPDVLALSALLHQHAKGLPVALSPPPASEPALQATWQAKLGAGAQLYATRMGRINLACVHCHDQQVGKQMRADVVSPANPTGFPIYRMSWQHLGSIDRRLRACYSGVQAVLPPAGDPVLRELELYLKVRATGLPLDGPSVRR